MAISDSADRLHWHRCAHKREVARWPHLSVWLLGSTPEGVLASDIPPELVAGLYAGLP